ncbi:MAG: MBL fold metallo-hydrolase [Verrucomicrobiota bacterium]|jgi:L-ascorbate metabolism protein UlaG (beta-lactamase superfamily)|nr:MBL fold metallo-hydrolase [Verrucomicrobiota bacterium]MDP7291857.1 MBL fold metallo-hydrolase [Verrucomicrobiota bacterium]MDP7441976.1 MBL fold metallo-hydrolase [Verrucomicrobiota bacterium]HJN83876.1 MBL fold metallo-hydrolase [Verrucomicrobiota bacterium]|tara:strand:+ start:96 stop:824 length:729 start_codon:yes stop_codon:yes gene_type:complete
MKTTTQIILALALAWSITAQAADKIKTAKGDLEIHPVKHGTVVFKWNGKTVFVDPVGGVAPFKSHGTPNLVLVTDIHGDHFNKDTLTEIVSDKTVVIAPEAVAALAPQGLKKRITTLANGKLVEKLGVKIEAVPMYNLTPARLRFHNKGRGNGYVMTFGGKRVYVSGDTEDIPEMRALKKIDAAFVCMNLPYTMTPEQAADAVREFKPRVVYPYHYRGSDTAKFKKLVGDASEVRLRDWYKK